MHCAILSGGMGKRLWPLSNISHPKPFLVLPNGHSMLQDAFMRALALCPEGIINVTSKKFFPKIVEEWSNVISQSERSFKSAYILEPFCKNTAAAVALACLYVLYRYGPKHLILVMPSDHVILDQLSFIEAINKAKDMALEGKIVAFGIKPIAAETGYGYIEYEKNEVISFTEKPPLDKALAYVSSGKYLWNSGIFCFEVGIMLAEMKKYCPDILYPLQGFYDNSREKIADIFDVDASVFNQIRESSIDYAVMEKSKSIRVVPCDMGWMDIGNFKALAEVYRNFNTLAI
jgi:mannose-1-phosphate guanylyltransferase